MGLISAWVSVPHDSLLTIARLKTKCRNIHCVHNMWKRVGQPRLLERGIGLTPYTDLSTRASFSGHYQVPKDLMVILTYFLIPLEVLSHRPHSFYSFPMGPFCYILLHFKCCILIKLAVYYIVS